MAGTCAAGGWWSDDRLEWSAQDIKVLSGTADSALNLVRNMSDGGKSVSELEPLILEVIAAAKAAGERIERHTADIKVKDRLDALEWADAMSCIKSTSMIAAAGGLSKARHRPVSDELTNAQRQRRAPHRSERIAEAEIGNA